ncbi:ribonuclease III domain-containing protein [Mycena rosella]|uniref:Ribonuclease III domain-containing protein n=1 Tax=Mycena rosella TaxID=1033263 RepID=A0AAD7M9B5_MYCRO|nr:ribonuclease III domain-containing protein [Mycena rosella]
MALKRGHSSQTQVPDLPKLSGDTLLQVFTHRSLRRVDQPKSFDNERLSVLGEKVLDLFITEALFAQRPMLTISEITTQKNQFFSPDILVWLVDRYGLLNHLRCHPDNFSSLNAPAPDEASSLLYAYVGGIFVDHDDDGILRQVVQSWKGLLSPQTPPLKKVKLEPDAYADALVLPNPLAPAQPTLPFLSSFNQAASQRGVTLDYPANFVGGQWSVQCVVNGIIKALGTTKKIAQEMAARHAYYAMGWA